jgi:CheY-like chemotaxis protein
MTLPHIAVVDDEVDITRLLSGYLKGHGYRVSELSSGAALMALMPTDPPALVLLDLGLPGEDGFVIARQLREHWRCGLVIVSACGRRAGGQRRRAHTLALRRLGAGHGRAPLVPQRWPGGGLDDR